MPNSSGKKPGGRETSGPSGLLDDFEDSPSSHPPPLTIPLPAEILNIILSCREAMAQEIARIRPLLTPSEGLFLDMLNRQTFDQNEASQKRWMTTEARGAAENNEEAEVPPFSDDSALEVQRCLFQKVNLIAGGILKIERINSESNLFYYLAPSPKLQENHSASRTETFEGYPFPEPFVFLEPDEIKAIDSILKRIFDLSISGTSTKSFLEALVKMPSPNKTYDRQSFSIINGVGYHENLWNYMLGSLTLKLKEVGLALIFSPDKQSFQIASPSQKKAITTNFLKSAQANDQALIRVVSSPEDPDISALLEDLLPDPPQCSSKIPKKQLSPLTGNINSSDFSAESLQKLFDPKVFASLYLNMEKKMKNAPPKTAKIMKKILAILMINSAAGVPTKEESIVALLISHLNLKEKVARIYLNKITLLFETPHTTSENGYVYLLKFNDGSRFFISVPISEIEDLDSGLIFEEGSYTASYVREPKPCSGARGFVAYNPEYEAWMSGPLKIVSPLSPKYSQIIKKVYACSIKVGEDCVIVYDPSGGINMDEDEDYYKEKNEDENRDGAYCCFSLKKSTLLPCEEAI